MQKEKLTCLQCNKDWQRVPTRGRKPKLCPSCLAAPVSTDSSTPATKSVQAAPTNDLLYPAPSKWLCASCGASVEIGVAINHPPTHHCHKRLRKKYNLELVRKAS